MNIWIIQVDSGEVYFGAGVVVFLEISMHIDTFFNFENCCLSEEGNNNKKQFN